MLIQTQLEAIIGRLQADTGTIHLIEDGVLILKAHAGVPSPVVEIVTRAPIGRGMAGLAAERNEVVTSCNIQADPTGKIPAGARETGVTRRAVLVERLNPGVLGDLEDR